MEVKISFDIWSLTQSSNFGLAFFVRLFVCLLAGCIFTTESVQLQVLCIQNDDVYSMSGGFGLTSSILVQPFSSTKYFQNKFPPCRGTIFYTHIIYTVWYCYAVSSSCILHHMALSRRPGYSTKTLPPVASSNWDPPAFNLAELRVSHIDEQGQLRHPHTHLQLGTQEAVGKVEHHAGLSSCLFSIDIHIVTALGHLDKTRRRERSGEWDKSWVCSLNLAHDIIYKYDINVLKKKRLLKFYIIFESVDKNCDWTVV